MDMHLLPQMLVASGIATEEQAEALAALIKAEEQRAYEAQFGPVKPGLEPGTFVRDPGR